MVRVLIERRISEGMVEEFHRTLREMRREAVHIAGLEAAADYLAAELGEGDVVMVMGAGDITKVTASLLDREGGRRVEETGGSGEDGR